MIHSGHAARRRHACGKPKSKWAAGPDFTHPSHLSIKELFIDDLEQQSEVGVGEIAKIARPDAARIVLVSEDVDSRDAAETLQSFVSAHLSTIEASLDSVIKGDKP